MEDLLNVPHVVIGGEIWFLANPFVNFMKYSNGNQVVRNHVSEIHQVCYEQIQQFCDPEVIKKMVIQNKLFRPNDGRCILQHNTRFINQMGLMELLTKTKKLSSNTLKVYVRETLLPKLREQNGLPVIEEILDITTNPTELQKKNQSLAAALKRQKRIIANLKIEREKQRRCLKQARSIVSNLKSKLIQQDIIHERTIETICDVIAPRLEIYYHNYGIHCYKATQTSSERADITPDFECIYSTTCPIIISGYKTIKQRITYNKKLSRGNTIFCYHDQLTFLSAVVASIKI